MKAINRLVTMLGLLLLFGIIALVVSLDTSVILALLDPASPTSTMMASTTSTKKAAFQTTASPIPVTPQPGWQVCTGVADGHLHVREKAGHQAPILGVLPESTNITPTGQHDGDWLEISAPLTGWVHSKYLCEKPGNRSVSP
jgi:uncharacterized protein YraI